jgi:hypothetical protein
MQTTQGVVLAHAVVDERGVYRNPLKVTVPGG